MANNDSATPITTGTVTGKPKERGIYYFKLGSEYFLYDEDEQRLCGLTGAEIDSNFHFLSGYDIKNVEINYSAGTVVITRVNDEFEPIVLDLKGAHPTPDNFVYSAETGELFLTYPDGTELKAEGFFIDEGKYDLKVYTDGTITGLGTEYSPLALSKLERTGTFAPVEKLLAEGEDIQNYKRKRILTKEIVDDYGHLYTYDEVEFIQSALTNSPWRVATKKDWDELLNAMEIDPEDRLHDASCSERNYGVGNTASDILKSNRLWEYPNGTMPDESNEGYIGFDMLPVGYDTFPETATNDNQAELFGSNAGFWAAMDEEYCVTDLPIVKLFDTGSSVTQRGVQPDGLFSVRLVRDYTPECEVEYETILGKSYPVGVITSPCDVDYAKVWTLSNFYSVGNGFSGKTIEGENVPPLTKYAYFINECDGQKKRMKEGESIVILDREQNPNLHEWRIIDGELVDTYNEIRADLAEMSGNLMTYVDELSANTVNEFAVVREEMVSLSGNVVDFTNEVSGNTVRALNILQNQTGEQINGLSETLEREVSDIHLEIDDVRYDCEDAISAVTNDLNNKIDVLSSATEESISAMATELSGAIESNISSLSAATEEAITNESTRAIAVEESLGDEISELSGNTKSEINRVDERINSFDVLSSATENFKESTLSELDRIGEDFERMVANTGGIADRVTAIEAQIPSINEDIEEVSNKVNDLSGATSEIVATIDETLDEISSTIPVDVVYSKPILKNSSLLGTSNIPTTGRIQLRLADGTYSDGFDASDFLIDSVLTNVEFNDADKTITFIWNDQFSSRQIIPLSALSHVYGVSPESVTYLRLDGNDFHPIVDGEGGFVKTLASTEFAENAAAQAASAAVAPIRTYIDILKGGDGQVGSVSHLIGDKFITDGLPVGQIDANQHSLLRAVDVNGELKYFVSAKAEDMYYTKPDGTNVILGNYITSLENRVAELESGLTAMSQRVASLESVGIDEAGVRQIIKNYLEGTEQEIKITENGDKLKVGFADDAVFGFITQ